jgi:hypothetical protein
LHQILGRSRPCSRHPGRRRRSPGQ